MTRTVSPDVAAQKFIALLDAACRGIEERWFHVPVSGTASNAYRERVYCYELYHQLRVLSDSPRGNAAGAPDYVLFGEIDKAGLNAVTDGGDEKPDLVWHVPGTRRNAAVLEVKHAKRLARRDVTKDLRTLGTFLSAAGSAYRCGVLLVFGPADREDLQQRIQRAVSAVQMNPVKLRYARLLWHRAVGAKLEDLGAITTGQRK